MAEILYVLCRALECSMNVRKPKVGDRVAIPTHAVVFFIKNVDEANKTVVAEGPGEFPKVEENIPWKLLTFIDS